MSDGLASRRERVAVARLLRDAIVLERALLEERKHCVSIAMDDPNLALEVDRPAVVHALANLLADAALFTPPGEGVDMFALRSGASVDLGVRESGLGLHAGKDARWLTQGWTIEREIALAHGGELRVVSDGQNLGATVCLRLPIGAGEAPSREPVRERPFRVAPRRRVGRRDTQLR